MTFAATVAQLLLSSPSDLPQEHREVVIRAIRTWNNSHGRRAAVIFSPTNWEEGSSPEYGVGPQDSLNRQVVDSSDLGLVIFTDRLGTPTKSHESGTVEEIERLHQQGKRVAILRNMAPREPSRDAAQSAALAAYLESIRDKALYREYRSLEELLAIVNSTLNDVSFGIEPPQQTPASRDREQNELSLGVWPAGDHERYQETDSKGHLKTKTRHRIVLRNDTGVPVTDVTIRLEDAKGNPAEVMRISEEPVARLAPGATHPIPIILHMGSPDTALCTVTWTDPDGQAHETSATVSLH